MQDSSMVMKGEYTVQQYTNGHFSLCIHCMHEVLDSFCM
jgi:hypothetical protein